MQDFIENYEIVFTVTNDKLSHLIFFETIKVRLLLGEDRKGRDIDVTDIMRVKILSLF